MLELLCFLARSSPSFSAFCRDPSLAAMANTPTSPASSSGGSSSGSQSAPTSASSVLRALTTAQPIPSSSTGVSREIDALLEAQKKMRAEKAQLAKDLKNAQRRRTRLKHKARLLSASDLASVLVMRQEEEDHKVVAAAKRRRNQQSAPRAGEMVDVGDLLPNSADRAEEDESNGSDEQQARDAADRPALT